MLTAPARAPVTDFESALPPLLFAPGTGAGLGCAGGRHHRGGGSVAPEGHVTLGNTWGRGKGLAGMPGLLTSQPWAVSIFPLDAAGSTYWEMTSSTHDPHGFGEGLEPTQIVLPCPPYGLIWTL